jgi:hypothetical protein
MDPKYFTDDLSKYFASDSDMLKLWSESFRSSETDAISALGLAMKSGFVDTAFVDTTITYERPKESTVSYTFESVADTDSAKQLQEERENLLVGIKALETTVMYHEDKSNELKNQLLIVEEQLSQLRPDSFKTGEFKLDSSSSRNRYVDKLEYEIVRAMRIGGALSDKTIMINPETWHEIAAHIGVNWSEVTSRTKVGGLTYKSITVVRSYDIEKGEIIVK